VAGVALTAIGSIPWAVASPTTPRQAAQASSLVLADDARTGGNGNNNGNNQENADTRASRNRSRATPPPTNPPANNPVSGNPAPTNPPPTNPARGTAPASSTTPAQVPAAQPPASPASTKRAPVAGLSQSQMDNAVAIVEAGRQMNLPRRAFVVAIATALQESNLRVLANPAVWGSTNHPNQGVGYDHDSIGLFQQRPNWGSVDQLMDPQESARRFYAVLMKLPAWEQLSVTVAAQRVQQSAFPDAYAKHQGLAEQIVSAIS
jgi:hypothetical protein